MRNALFAALMALATGIVAVPSAQAGGITITVDDGSGYYGQRDSRWQRYDRDDRRWNQAHRDDRRWGWQQRRSIAGTATAASRSCATGGTIGST